MANETLLVVLRVSSFAIVEMIIHVSLILRTCPAYLLFTVK